MTDENNVNQQQQGDVATPENATGNNGGQGGANDNPTWLPERLARARSAAVNELLKELGLEKADDLKTLVEKARAEEAAKMSEVEKAKKEAEKEKADREKAQAEIAQLKAERLKDKADGALRTAAIAAKAQDADDVIMWCEKNAPEELSGLVDENGKPVAAKVEALVKKVQAAKPSWFATGGPGSPSNKGGKTPQGKPKQVGPTFKL